MVIGLAVMVGSDLWIFLNLPGFMIVVGGTFAATLIKFPLTTCMSAFIDGIKVAFVDRKEDPESLIEQASELAGHVRKGGLLALERQTIKNAFLKKGIMMCVDGNNPEFIQKVLTTDMMQTIQREEVGERIFRAIGDSAPAFGMIGTLVGLVQMLTNMGDPATIGPAMAIALLTTLYGALIANLIAIPMADKMETKAMQDRNNRTLIIESVLSIQRGENPRLMGDLLEVYVKDDRRRAAREERRRSAG